jgi:hypothetical protein
LSGLWEVPAYLIMAFSLALDAPVGKASRVSTAPSSQISATFAFDAQRHAAMPETIWLRAVKTAGPHSSVLRYYADRIFITSIGKFYVPSDSDRAEISAMQNNSEVVTRVIAAATRANKYLLSELGNKPTPGVLHVAHVFGIASAQRFCAALKRHPEAPATLVLPELAGELQSMPGMTVAALDAKLTALVTGDVTVPRSHGSAVRTPDRFAFGAGALKGTVTRSESVPEGCVAHAR